MPRKESGEQTAHQSPRRRKIRADPASPVLQADAAETEAFYQGQSYREVGREVALSAHAEALDTETVTNGASKSIFSAKEVKVTEATTEVKPTTTKRKKVVLEEDENQIDNAAGKKTKRTKKIKREDVDILSNEESLQKPKLKPKSKTTVKSEILEETEAPSDAATPEKRTRKTKAKVKQQTAGDGGEEDAETPKKTKRKRKTKEEKEAEAMPIAVRTLGLSVHNSVTNCVHIGGNAFAMFLKSQRKWENPPLQDDHRDYFRAFCTEHKFDAASHILPHGSYLVNLAQEDPEKHTQAYDAFMDDLHRCEALGIKLYNFHPGWTGPTATRPSALTRIAASLNRAHSATKIVTPVLETMAGSGSVIGSTFSDLASIIEQVDDKSRVGVCIDTCHIFAAGFDLRSPSSFAGVMDEFEKVIGFRYLKALHLNDSKAPFGSHRDLHANIGTGFLGLRAFHNVMNEKRFQGLPMVLETPIDRKDPENEKKTIEDKTIWAKEIKMLESLVGMDAESEEFKRLEAELSELGKEERDKHWEQYERKLEKEAKAVTKSKGKSKKGEKEKAQGKQTTLKWQGNKVDTLKADGDSSDSDLSSVDSTIAYEQ